MVWGLPYRSTPCTALPFKGITAAPVLFLLTFGIGAPDEGVSSTREAWPSPIGDDPSEKALGVYPIPVLFILGSNLSLKLTADNL
jgi:hypothetical protein